MEAYELEEGANGMEVFLRNTVRNLRFVTPLNYDLKVELRDEQFGLIAQGMTEFRDLDLLTPVEIDSATITRASRELSGETVVIIRFRVSNFAFSMSKLSILIPRHELSGSSFS